MACPASVSTSTTATPPTAELKAKGVEFLQEPEDRPYGIEALMRDNSGNWMVLVEPRDYSPEDFEGVDFG